MAETLYDAGGMLETTYDPLEIEAKVPISWLSLGFRRRKG